MQEATDVSADARPERVGWCTHEIFHRSYKFIFACLGVSFQEKQLKHRLIQAFMIWRVMMTSPTIYAMFVHPSLGFFIMFTFSGTFLCPLTAYIILSRRLAKVNHSIDAMFHLITIKAPVHHEIARTISKLIALAVIVISCDYLAQLGMGFLCLTQSPEGNWVFSRTKLINFALTEPIRPFVSYLFYLHDSLANCFISSTTSLYLIYYYLLIRIKRATLDTFNTRIIHNPDVLIDRLDEFIDTFESLFSFLPFIWLTYCSGPGLCFILDLIITSKQYDKSTSVLIVVHCFNMLALLSSLFVISYWQEGIERQEVLFSRQVALRGSRMFSQTSQEHFSRVLRRKVTVWFIVSIDRSLILAAIGSAITFSTLFIQLSSKY